MRLNNTYFGRWVQRYQKTMNKLIVCIIACISLCVSVNAQKIKVNEMDKFTKQQIIETSFEKIVSDNKLLSPSGGRLMKDIWIAFRKVGDMEYMRLKWCTNNVLAMDSAAKVIFLDDNGNTYTFLNTEFTVAGEGEGTVGLFGSALYGLNIYLTGDYSALEGKNITDMRIYTTDGYIDFELNKKARNTIAKTYKVFKDAQK